MCGMVYSEHLEFSEYEAVVGRVDWVFILFCTVGDPVGDLLRDLQSDNVL
jgi:hypothetical protein